MGVVWQNVPVWNDETIFNKDTFYPQSIRFFPPSARNAVNNFLNKGNQLYSTKFVFEQTAGLIENQFNEIFYEDNLRVSEKFSLYAFPNPYVFYMNGTELAEDLVCYTDLLHKLGFKCRNLHTTRITCTNSSVSNAFKDTYTFKYKPNFDDGEEQEYEMRWFRLMIQMNLQVMRHTL